MKIETKNRPRFSPIRNLTPERLTQMLDAFEQGYLAEAALTWDTIEKRDDTIKSVAPKRKKAIARHGWEVIVSPNLPCDKQAEALKHKEALEYFYTNRTCSHALDGNERGGFKLMVRQMMDAIGKRYAVHEILWKSEGVRDAVGGAEFLAVRARIPQSGLTTFGWRERFQWGTNLYRPWEGKTTTNHAP
jgi:phage gp29-like protein